jgi:hypothetical protein
MGSLIPRGWDEVVVRSALALAAAFLALGMKEFIETQRIDLPGVSIDVLWVAGAALALNGLLRVLSPKRTA